MKTILFILGITSERNPDTDLSCLLLNLNALYDKRGYSLLMIAAEKGDINAVKYILKHKADESYEVNRNIAIDLVDKNSKHYGDILMSLLQENSRFPRNFEYENSSDDLKIFVTEMQEMHKAIKEGNKKEVLDIIESYPNLRYFFVPSKKSLSITAYRVAEKCGQNEMIQIFKEKNLLKASFEMGRQRSATDGMSTIQRIRKYTLVRGHSTPAQTKRTVKEEGVPLQPIKENSGGEKANETPMEQFPNDEESQLSPNQSDQNSSIPTSSDGRNERNFPEKVKNFFLSPISFFARRHRKEQDRLDV
jgi:ankyrin repeat protein